MIAKTGIGVGDVVGSFDHSIEAARGRVAAAWAHVGPDTGMIFVSVYLYHSEGPTARNRAIIQKALAVAQSHGSPWILAGDMNMPPTMFMQAWGGLLELANAYLMAPEQATHCPTSGSHSILDYAICSCSAEPWVDAIQVDQGFEASPHRAVRLSLRATPKNYLIQSI